ncbi:glycosyltransferase family 2 protein [Hymenobacter sp. DG25A]|uniref:glycosyltransferase family 2 protein n=1 Tax=Hymenobacter sp. DG25A TaxID=1385663 RepID=UPI000B12F702|nr:glycosyltransferase family A protein [Hymenobacter sp. DG25A]
MKNLVSILLPVYNVEDFIHKTIYSLLNQTYQDLEIIVVDDRSTDRTVEKIREINDPRIKLIVNETNLGRAGSDNVGMQYVKGEYVAKMDGDDICHPERLARQVAVLDSRPDINVVGCWLQNFGASDYLHKYPITPEELKVRTLFTLPGGTIALCCGLRCTSRKV